MDGSEGSRYQVPRYRAPDDTAFYHVLHGTVPGHQIDFMYCPEVPQGALAQTHFGHLTRLMPYIEARSGAPYGFALGNLSRDDVQYEPGHGGIAILFALRVAGVTDHAGRDMPPYAHGIVAVDRSLEYVQLVEAMIRLHRRFIERADADHERGEFYRAYVRLMQEQPEVAEAFLAQTIAQIADIPRPPPSRLGFDFEVAADAPPPARIYIVHDDNESFSTLAHYTALMGAGLYRSNVKWTSITTGREIEITGGSSVRFLPASEAHTARGPTHSLDALPDDEEELLHFLFGARRRTPKVPVRHQGWREKLRARSEHPPARDTPSYDSQDSFDIDVEIDDAAATLVAGFDQDGVPLPPRPLSSRPPPSDSASGFDPRRSSPVTGTQAVRAGSEPRFDPRRSSPVTGAQAVALTPANPPMQMAYSGSSAAPFEAGLQAPASIQSAMSSSVPTHLDRSSTSRSSKGRLIIAAAAFAAIMVIVIVSVVAGMAMQKAETQPNGGEAGASK